MHYSPKILFTLGDIARHFDVTQAVAKYGIEAARIEPADRVGILRIWHADQLPTIENAIRRTARVKPQAVPA